jgi:chromosome segregation ATPase
MNAMPKIAVFVLSGLALGAAAGLRADDQQEQSAETRMRAALRDTMVQLRDAQNQVVTLQAGQAQSDKDKADLQAKVDALSGQLKTATDNAAADKTDADKAITQLKSQLDDDTTQIATLTDSLKQWKTAYDQTSQLAAAKEAARAQLEMQAALLKRTVDDRESKNLALYQLGSEILKRYENFGLGDALTAREPFIGVSRVKLENMVQDYKYKLLDQAVVSGQPLPPLPPAPATPGAPEKPSAQDSGDAAKSDKTDKAEDTKPTNPT